MNLPREKAWHHEAEYGGLDYRGALVLDIGADYGTTAEFFLDRGASRVLAVEASPEWRDRLVAWAHGKPVTVLPGALGPDTAHQIMEHRPDVVKCDCEGAEASLLDLPDDLLCAPSAWVMETHTAELYLAFSERLGGLGYDVTVVKDHGPEPNRSGKLCKVIQAVKPFPTVIAWSWGSAHYHKGAGALKQACDALDYPNHIALARDMDQHFEGKLPNVPTRRWTWRYTARFIARTFEELRSDLLYLHADYTLAGPVPVHSWSGLDVAVQRGDGIPNPRPDLVQAAPIFLRWGDTARAFVGEWARRCAEVDDTESEHGHLYDVFMEATARGEPGVGYFTPSIASVYAKSDLPIRGHR